MGLSSRCASIDWSWGGLGTLMKSGDSGGMIWRCVCFGFACRCRCWVGVLLEKKARGVGLEEEEEDIQQLLRGRRAGRGRRGGILDV